MKAFHRLIQSVLSATTNHDIRVPQLFVIPLQKLTNHDHCRRVNPHPPKGQRLEKLGGGKDVPARDVRKTKAAVWSATLMELYVGGRTPACHRCCPRQRRCTYDKGN